MKRSTTPIAAQGQCQVKYGRVSPGGGLQRVQEEADKYRHESRNDPHSEQSRNIPREIGLRPFVARAIHFRTVEMDLFFSPGLGEREQIELRTLRRPMLAQPRG